MNARDFPPMDDGMEFAQVDMVNREAEQALLGSLLVDSRMYDVVGDLVDTRHFSNDVDGSIFGAIASLSNSLKPVDLISVHEHLQGRVDMPYLNQLNQSAAYSASRVRHYAGIVHERAQSRQLAAVVNDAREMATDHLVPIAERVEKVSAKLASLLDDAPGDEWIGSATGMNEFMAAMMERAEGKKHDFMPSGLTALDEQLDGGFREGELVIIGARPSMGKTALAVTIGMHAARTGHATAMFSLEMQRADLYTRQVAMVSNVSMSKIKRPERSMTQTEWSQMTEAVEFISHLPFYVNDKSNLNINTLRAKARALKRRFGLRLLIVDYLGLMDGTDPKANRTTQLGEVTRNLKKLAKELGITVLLLAQLNRELEKRVDQMPILSDLRDCGEIEQDADIVLFPHRPIHSKPSLGEEWRYYAALRVAKQRGGATGDLNLKYVGHLVRFETWHGDKPGTGNGYSNGSFE